MLSFEFLLRLSAILKLDFFKSPGKSGSAIPPRGMKLGNTYVQSDRPGPSKRVFPLVFDPWKKVEFTLLVSHLRNKCIFHSNAEKTNQAQRPGKPGPGNKNPSSSAQQNRRPSARGVFPARNVFFDPKALKSKDSKEIVHILNEGLPRLKFLLRSQDQQHNNDEFICDLTSTLGKACNVPPGENINKILATLKGSAFFNSKIPSLLDRLEESTALNDQVSRQRFLEHLTEIFMKYLTHLPSSYADLPYTQLKVALDQSSVQNQEELQTRLDEFKQARNDVIRAERQRHGKRFVNRAGEKPPNDFRDMPICPETKEITTQERPFLRENISKGRYNNAEHYLDVQFRLLREDFLEPLKEGISEIVLNIPRHQRKQLMKNYRSVQIVGKEFTWSGITHQVQIDVSGLDTSRWAHSKRLLYGSFLCLSKDNFKTMLFATVCDRDPKKVKKGRINVRFIENQDVFGIERRNCVYQMVESPAYFEAYRYVLKGLQELDETTLPFQKYLVECSGEVDPPEYLRRDESEEPVYYDLGEALQMLYLPNTTSTVPVLRPEAWPSVEGLPLNKSQLEALKTAITTEFSVIQGPPGTGKTYVGAKIVRCLLDNRSAWDPRQTSPMLMVCYTNHALDQFLEKVLEFLSSRKIIRVGGRCKSDKLENCNLKKFTYRYRLHGKREEVNEKLRQNNIEMEMSKQQLAKANHQLLEFEDVEQLIFPAHLQQLCNAKFPSKVANESRTPSNTFKLWLCKNKEMDCNQTAKAPTLEKPVENEGNELPYDATMFTEPQDESERPLGEPLAAVDVSKDVAKPDLRRKMSMSEPLAAVNVSNDVAKTDLRQKMSMSEPLAVVNVSNEVAKPDLRQKMSMSEPLAAVNVSNDVAKPDVQQEMSISEETKLNENSFARGLPSDLSDEQRCTVLEGIPSDANAGENRETDEETIAIEREADLIQQQRWIEGDEDLLLPISKETGDLITEELNKRGTNEENDNGEWTLVTHKKKGQSHFWMPNDEDNSKEDGKLNDEETGGTMSAKKKKKRKKKNKKKVQITEDIYSIQEDLNNIKMMSTEEVIGIQNIWNISQSDRLRLYLFWIENYREHFRVEIHHAERVYEQLCEELKEVQFEEEEQVIRQATVVGMTTSGAARYHSVLQRIAPKIVVIEEAAEVMEAHIITSLSHNTKHTILIGDHKQLRPKATVYELAQKYNLEVSLFERMVLNSMDCKRLSIQHRMRPEIATLTKRIYDHEIVDHDSVCNFPPISGLCHNLFFIDHCQPEKLIGGLQSYSNHHEAEFLVALCEYLLRQGYERKQITILTMYTGQLLLLQEKMPRRAFEGVKVCAVDNFQGEENDIILLSLVRSNSEGRIGFLGESNRICVALSRARQGFYCIGNFNLLKSHCKLWKEICADLNTKEAIGDNLQLICKRHKNVTNVRCAREFKQCELGGCTMPCADRLECGHACDKLCHVSDVYHALGRCIKMCFNSCSSGHKCHNKCHYPRECPKCSVLVRKTPACGHEQSLRCSIDPDDVSSGFQCERKVIKILPCGHNNLMKCYKDPIIYSDCSSSCTKVLDCGHTCSERCTQKCKCGTKIDIELPCNHRKQVLCREKNNPIDCSEKCERALNCGHACPGICHEECATKLCKIKVLKDLPCGHQQIVRCFQEPQNVFCSSVCERLLNCGHKCPSLCGRLCQEIRCRELCLKSCEREHPCQKQCHYGSSCDKCTVLVNATIPVCGHVVKVPCFINPATLICKQPCERLRSCGHPCKEICGKDCETLPCQIPVTRELSCKHVVDLACHKRTETFICKTEIGALLPCGHKTSLECYVAKGGLDNVLCMEKIEKELRCGHKTTLPCYTNAALSYCQKKVEITLSCGHKKLTTCSEKEEQFQNGRCYTKVRRRLLCGHEKVMHCSDKADRVFCDEPCERVLPCKHPCGNRCGDDCTNFRCAVGVKKALSCGHHDISCLCSEDVSQRLCSNPCKRRLSCGHQCPGKCYERCSEYKCQVLVTKKLPCAGNHSLKMFCKDNPNSVACPARCDRKLDCGHPCPGLCSQACGTVKCRRKVVKEYRCGHKQQIPCFESKTAICKAPCQRREGCTHKCKGFCGEPCSNYPCQVPLVKTLPCGHRVNMPCSFRVDEVQCPVSCQAKLSCGHECSGTCGECKQRGSHEICQNPCNRVLVCSHRCQETCGKPCPPCARQCSRRCPHTKYSQQCSQPCRPCIKPCNWNCPHYQCNNPCGEECDRPRCDAPCPKKLPCRHPCIGLCGENCPTMCAICHSKKLSSMIGQANLKVTEGTRYMQLFDCGHIVKVQEMDEWMLRDMGDNVNQIQCPRCSIPITFSYRYGNIVKRILRNMENVKNRVHEIGNETTRFTRELLITLRQTPKEILIIANKLSRRPGSKALDKVQMRHIPFVFALRNSLLILHQIEKAYLILQAVEKCQVTNHSRTIKDALEKISDYLSTPQFDLGTVRQLNEHTRTLTLFASIIEAQCQAINCRGSFSSIGVSRLKVAEERFDLFMQGNSKVLQNEWLEKIAASLRNEVGLLPLPPEEPKTEFKNFPGYNTSVWKLCRLHGQVYLTTSFMCEGEDVSEINGCRQCDGTDDTDEDTG